MQFDILNEKQNPLFKRKEIIIKMGFDGATPSKAALQQMFAKEFKTEPNRVEINKILSAVGKDIGKVWLRIWEEKDIEIYGKKETPTEAPAAEAK